MPFMHAKILGSQSFPGAEREIRELINGLAERAAMSGSFTSCRICKEGLCG
jgi:hypothetical protein